jgi:hypothetical protein
MVPSVDCRFADTERNDTPMELIRVALAGVAGSDWRISRGEVNAPAAMGATQMTSAAELAGSLFASISIRATAVEGVAPSPRL